MTHTTKTYSYLLGTLCFVSVLAVHNFAQAAEFYFGTAGPVAEIDAPIEIGVFIDTEGQIINAVQGVLEFPPDFTIIDVKDGNSVINFWPVRPAVATDSVSFEGIVPGGYQGAQGYLFSVVALPTAVGSRSVTMRSPAALLNDGKGTAAQTRASALQLRVTKDQGREFLEAEDTTPPETFLPSVGQDPEIFSGSHFLVFAAQDKQSGIDRFEVREGRLGSFVPAESPYQLTHQGLNRRIFVRAFDRAGNERLAVLEAPQGEIWYERFELLAILIGIGVLVLLGAKIVWSKFARS